VVFNIVRRVHPLHHTLGVTGGKFFISKTIDEELKKLENLSECHHPRPRLHLFSAQHATTTTTTTTTTTVFSVSYFCQRHARAHPRHVIPNLYTKPTSHPSTSSSSPQLHSFWPSS
jgi:hypothetical protein